jgi:hypothetical protein
MVGHSEIVAQLLAEAGPTFEFDPPEQLRAGEPWPWQVLTQALIHATERLEEGDLVGVVAYLEQLFGEDPDGAAPGNSRIAETRSASRIAASQIGSANSLPPSVLPKLRGTSKPTHTTAT